jgi:hypothetical protein
MRFAVFPIVTLLLFIVTVSVRSQYDPTIDGNYDRFEDKTTLRALSGTAYGSKGVGSVRLRMAVTTSFIGRKAPIKPQLFLFIMSSSENWQFLNDRRLFAISNGKRMVLGSMHRLFSDVQRGGGVSETLGVPVNLATIEQFSRASFVDMRVGAVEFSLDTRDCANLSQFLKQLRGFGGENTAAPRVAATPRQKNSDGVEIVATINPRSKRQATEAAATVIEASNTHLKKGEILWNNGDPVGARQEFEEAKRCIFDAQVAPEEQPKIADQLERLQNAIALIETGRPAPPASIAEDPKVGDFVDDLTIVNPPVESVRATTPPRSNTLLDEVYKPQDIPRFDPVYFNVNSPTSKDLVLVLAKDFFEIFKESGAPILYKTGDEKRDMLLSWMKIVDKANSSKYQRYNAEMRQVLNKNMVYRSVGSMRISSPTPGSYFVIGLADTGDGKSLFVWLSSIIITGKETQTIEFSTNKVDYTNLAPKNYKKFEVD